MGYNYQDAPRESQQEYFGKVHTDNKETLEKQNEQMRVAINVLITTLNDTTWDEGHPGYSDSEPSYLCPQCSCKDCYRVSCQYNESELFKKLYKELPELYENKV